MRPPRPGASGSAVPDQDIERLLLLSLIRIHLSRASTDALCELEGDMRSAPARGQRGSPER
jgi:hypothetical protein